jgi:membrane fusion protein, multidrug efflux system
MRATSWLFGSCMVVFVAGGVFAARQMVKPAGSGPNFTTPPVRPIPVTTGIVEVRDFPIYVIGLGTVQAFDTVTVRVRVDGEVQKIAFSEGQDVRTGDLLARIDARPYAAQLQQAEADKKRDEAVLANAKLDLDRYTKLVAKDFATWQSVDTQKALSRNIKRPSRTTRLSSTTPKSNLAIPPSPRLLPAGSGYGSSTKATSCMRPIRRDLWW